MSKITIANLSLLAAFGMASFAINAASTGTITFNGELTDTTCDVSINGQGPDSTVILPVVSINDLTQAGQTAGRTTFDMNLTDCVIGVEGGQTTVAAFFQPGATVDVNTGRLLNVGGSATNVGLQLLDVTDNNSVINVGNADQTTNAGFVDIDETAGTATLPYAVEYYADAATTPGTVTSSVIYNIIYK